MLRAGLVLSLSLLCACLATNYDDPRGPRHAGDARREAVEARAGRVLKVVTFNIKFAYEIELAIDELERAGLADADAIALQEMDRRGTERIAEALRMSWVYYPSSIHMHGRGFGNAILSRWPIADDRKIILPHPSPGEERLRIAVAAEIAHPAGRFVVYSVHDATVTSPLGHRLAQVRTILDDCAEHCGRLPVVLAGDYNTSDDRGLFATAEMHARRGFSPATPTRLPTARPWLGNESLDHVFVRGFDRLDYGVAQGIGASDHRAVWVEIRMR
jgi:endonuclease/exonuclease/phosphatase family metal-dependent hydrolase